jgi:hypothetical protein
LARFTPWVDSASVESPFAQSPGMAMPGLWAGQAPPYVSKRHGPLHKRPVQIDPRPRQMVGLAKKHASHIAREQGVGVEGGLWAVRCKVEPIKDRPHQLHVVQYLRDHVEEGGILWSAILAQMTEQERAELGKSFTGEEQTGVPIEDEAP